MTALTGAQGNVYLHPANSQEALMYAGVKKFEIEDKAEFEDTTYIGSGYNSRTKSLTTTDWVVTIEGYLDDENSQLFMDNLENPVIRAGNEIGFILSYDPADYTDTNGIGIVQSFKPTLTTDGLVNFTLVIEGTGELGYSVVEEPE